jgi:hypothetical protein
VTHPARTMQFDAPRQYGWPHLIKNDNNILPPCPLTIIVN